MRRTWVTVAAMVGAVVLGLAAAPQAQAGTQDFTLVNATGVDINNLYISETSKEDWEEDVLGDNTLPDGESVHVTFSGRKACSWDLMVKDEEGNGVYWRKIDLCKVSQVTLHCDENECWATFE